jgi:hypothetical protein
MAELWNLIRGKPEVDATALAEAIEREVCQPDLDFRTRLLIRDSTEALGHFWGAQQLAQWLKNSPARSGIEAIQREDLGAPGFPTLKGRIVAKTEPKTIEQFLRDLGTHLTKRLSLQIGGSAALILRGFIARATEDIDVVDEVPAEIREQRSLLDQLASRYGLCITHFQSHYLPSGWEKRTHSIGAFGQLHVFLVDAHDIWLSKLFSNREKDRDDLRVLQSALDKETLVRRLQDTTQGLRGDPALRQCAEQNWYILYGEPLPVETDWPGASNS